MLMHRGVSICLQGELDTICIVGKLLKFLHESKMLTFACVVTLLNIVAMPPHTVTHVLVLIIVFCM